MPSKASQKVSPPSLPAKPRRQVAAVCYRARKRGIEFLLVQTRGGRWIFPKGGAEPRLTRAQSAALEAWEEAGVHGRIEQAPFGRYLLKKTNGGNGAGTTDQKRAVATFLCEVSRLEPPQESKRRPTWFSVEDAKIRLSKDRTAAAAAELTRLVEKALERIHRMRIDRSQPALNSSSRFATKLDPKQDELQKVRFEAPEGRIQAPFAAAIEMAAQAHWRKLRALASNRPKKLLPAPRPNSGPSSATPKITAIDSRTSGSRARPAAAKTGTFSKNNR